MAATPETLTSGDTWRHAWELTDEAGVAVDLSGASARLHLRDAGGGKVAQASTDDGRLLIDGPAGRVMLVVPPSATALPAGAYRFALELTYPPTLGQAAVVETLPPEVLVITEDLVHD